MTSLLDRVLVEEESRPRAPADVMARVVEGAFRKTGLVRDEILLDIVPQIVDMELYRTIDITEAEYNSYITSWGPLRTDLFAWKDAGGSFKAYGAFRMLYRLAPLLGPQVGDFVEAFYEAPSEDTVSKISDALVHTVGFSRQHYSLSDEQLYNRGNAVQNQIRKRHRGFFNPEAGPETEEL